MKILIVEDSPIHQEAARQQLEGNELVIMKSFTEFFNAVTRNSLDLTGFDIVLTDINLPSPHDELGQADGATGFVVAFKAVQAGVKKIGIVTDANHHKDVHSKALDLLCGLSKLGDFTIFAANYAKFNAIRSNLKERDSRGYDFERQQKEFKEGTLVIVKNWKMVFDALVTGIDR